MIYLEKEIRYFCLQVDCKKSTAIPKAFSDSSDRIDRASFIASYREIESLFEDIREK